MLKINEYKMPADGEGLKMKRVGSRNVSRKEVDRAQQCEIYCPLRPRVY